MSKNISETILRDLGLKVTGPRLKVLQILQQSQHKHYSAEAIYEALKLNQIDIGMASVYRILTQFETLGLVKKHNFEDGRFVMS
jgi:Fur family ferric uptake transcriptional regulator